MFSKRTSWELKENAYTRALRDHRLNRRELFDLTVSNPTTCGFSYDEDAIVEALQVRDSLRYEPDAKGLPSARAAVVEYYAGKGLTQADPERFILTTGTSEAYSFLFRLLCEAGDEIAIPHPSYPLLDFLADIQDVKLRPFRCVYDHGWQIDFDALQQAIGERTRAVLVVHPNNPTGHFVAADEAERLIRICAERNLALIVDEVFLDYAIRGVEGRRKRRGSFVSTQPALTFVLSGLSKIAGLPQMKLGWIAASGPEHLVSDAIARLEVIADTYLSLSAPLQLALPALLSRRETMQTQIMSRVEANLSRLDAQLAQSKIVSRLELEGGWNAVLRVPAVQSDEEFAIRLLAERSVLVQPGHFYDFANDGYIVVSLIILAEEFEEGISRLLAFVGEK